jgi:alkylation response protein AidB-like acyl-CoA dehydrogenase
MTCIATTAPMFALPEEQIGIRAAIRELCEAKIAPHSAEVDRDARYIREAHNARCRPAFLAPLRPCRVRRSWRRRAGYRRHHHRADRPGRSVGIADPRG